MLNIASGYISYTILVILTVALIAGEARAKSEAAKLAQVDRGPSITHTLVLRVELPKVDVDIAASN
jgi:hypothetical protein